MPYRYKKHWFLKLYIRLQDSLLIRKFSLSNTKCNITKLKSAINITRDFLRLFDKEDKEFIVTFYKSVIFEGKGFGGYGLCFN